MHLKRSRVFQNFCKWLIRLFVAPYGLIHYYYSVFIFIETSEQIQCTRTCFDKHQ